MTCNDARRCFYVGPIRKDVEPPDPLGNQLVHCTEDEASTLCGIRLNHKWFLCPLNTKLKPTCKRCIKLTKSREIANAEP